MGCRTSYRKFRLEEPVLCLPGGPGVPGCLFVAPVPSKQKPRNHKQDLKDEPCNWEDIIDYSDNRLIDIVYLLREQTPPDIVSSFFRRLGDNVELTTRPAVVFSSPSGGCERGSMNFLLRF